MQIIYDKNNWDEEAVAATIGFFDGVHPGHRLLLQEVKQLAAERGIPSALITFPVHPRVVLRADYQPKLLNSFGEKLNLLSETGVDYIIVLDFTPELAALTAREFMETILVPDWHVCTLLVGYNHRFGSKDDEEKEQYALDGKACCVEVIKTSAYSSMEGMAISSSKIRRLLEAGDVAKFSSLLGYNYQLRGHIIKGNHLGRQMGFPTANIEVDEKNKVIPRNGSYAVRITTGNKKYNGMLYIGSRPSIGNDDSLRFEVNIFDFADDIYDEPISVEFVTFVRESQKFDSLDELSKQIQADKEKAMLLIDRSFNEVII